MFVIPKEERSWQVEALTSAPTFNQTKINRQTLLRVLKYKITSSRVCLYCCLIQICRVEIFLRWFLPYNKENQPYVYIHPLPPGPSSPHPTPLGHHRAPGWAPCASHQLPTRYLFYTWQCDLSVLISRFIPSFPCPPCVHTSILCVCVSTPAL